MIKIGITGGIGSGKSLICSIVEHLGYPVFYSDKEAKQILDSNEFVKGSLIRLLGKQIYSSGKLDRAVMAKLLFTDKSLISKVNSIVHPIVRSTFESWINDQKMDIVFNEAAILFETGAYLNFDSTVLVTAPTEIRIERVMLRDFISKEQVIERMDNQWTDDQKEKLATYTIVNDGIQPILSQIEKIIDDLKRSNEVF